MESSLGCEPNFTNYTSMFKGTLDYIWYTPSRLRIMATTALPDENELLSYNYEGLPSANFPSDHLMLCCDIALVITGIL